MDSDVTLISGRPHELLGGLSLSSPPPPNCARATTISCETFVMRAGARADGRTLFGGHTHGCCLAVRRGNDERYAKRGFRFGSGVFVARFRWTAVLKTTVARSNDGACGWRGHQTETAERRRARPSSTTGAQDIRCGGRRTDLARRPRRLVRSAAVDRRDCQTTATTTNTGTHASRAFKSLRVKGTSGILFCIPDNDMQKKKKISKIKLFIYPGVTPNSTEMKKK